MSDTFKYWAFISYSHKDKKAADWLHKALEAYRVPKKLVGSTGRDGIVPKRIYPVFRDREELPTSASLGANIEQALLQSKFLIVVCSPNSAKSMWVNEEIKTFKAQGKAERILCLIIDGEPNASDHPEQQHVECFPPSIRFTTDEQGNLTSQRSEPIAADMRSNADGKLNAKLKVLAGLLGVNFDDLKQRDRRRAKQRKALFGLASMAVLLAVVATVFLFEQLQAKRDFEYAVNAIRVAQVELDQGRLSNGVLLAQHALNSVQNLRLGRYTNWLESLWDVPLSYQAGAHRDLLVHSQALLTEAVQKHPQPASTLTQAVTESEEKPIVSLAAAPSYKESSRPKYYAENTQEDSVAVFAVNTGKLVNEFSLGGAAVEKFTLVPQADWLVVVSQQRDLFIWHIDSGRQLMHVEIGGGDSEILEIAVSSSTDFLYIHFSDRKLWLYDLKRDKPIALHRYNPVVAVAFRPEYEQLAISNERGIHLVALTSLELIALLRNDSGTSKLFFDSTGDKLISQAGDLIREYQMAATVRRHRLLGRFGNLQTLEFSSTGEALLGLQEQSGRSNTKGREIHIWETRSGNKINSVQTRLHDIEVIEFSPDASHVIAQSRSGLELWKSSSGEPVLYLDKAIAEYKVHPSGDAILIRFSTGEVEIWSLRNGERLGSLATKHGAFNSVDLSADGSRIVTSSTGGIIEVWDWGTLKQVSRFELAAEQPVFVKFNNAGNHIAINSRDKTARIWDLLRDRVVELPGHEYEYGRTHFSADDALLVTTDYPDFSSTTRQLTIRIWNAVTGELLNSLGNHWNYSAPRARFLSDSGHLLTVADTVRIFDALAGELVAVFPSARTAVDRKGQQAVIRDGQEYYLLQLPNKAPSLNQFIEQVIPHKLSEAELSSFFPETPPLLGY